jgi:hypothetical protein
MFRQEAPQPRNREVPVVLAVKVTGVLGEKLAEQVGGQLIPVGLLVTVPVPGPINTTVIADGLKFAVTD